MLFGKNVREHVVDANVAGDVILARTRCVGGEWGLVETERVLELLSSGCVNFGHERRVGGNGVVVDDATGARTSVKAIKMLVKWKEKRRARQERRMRMLLTWRETFCSGAGRKGRWKERKIERKKERKRESRRV
jgi:hypothetical protein